MSSRERWTVYPLLFLTLGIALKDKLTRVVDTPFVKARVVNSQQLICRQLAVTDPAGRIQVQIEATPQGGLARFNAPRPGVSVAVGHFPETSLGDFRGELSGLFISDVNGRGLPGFLVRTNAQVKVSPPPVETPPEEAPDAKAGEPQ
jgi:hypothetical protein